MEAIDFLKEWAVKENWRSHLYNNILEGSTNDIEKLANDVKQIILNKTPIKNKDFLTTKNTYEDINLKLNSVKYPKNINALSEDISFDLGNNLNVFYGENGSGKSSYVKVFRKLAANYFTREKELGLYKNVYKKYTSIEKQTIELIYELNGTKVEEIVDINVSNINLEKINVFDSESVFPLLNDDLSFNILPKGFQYFEKISQTIDELRKYYNHTILIKETDSATIFQDSSFDLIKNEIDEIQTKARSENLELYIANFHPKALNYEQELEEISEKISSFSERNIENTKRLLIAQRKKLNEVLKSLTLAAIHLSKENILEVNTLIEDFSEKVKEERLHNEEFKKQVEYLEVMNKEWLDFIKKGKRYYESLNRDNPLEGEQCIFCSHTLSGHHIRHINNQFDHIDSNSIREKKELEMKIANKNVENFQLFFNSEDEYLFHKEVLVAKIKSTISFVNQNLELLTETIREIKPLERIQHFNFIELTSLINLELSEINNQLNKINDSKAETVNLIKDIEKYKEVLIKNKLINDNIQLFLKWFSLKNEIEEIKNVRNNLSTALLTRKAKEAYTMLIENEYTELFYKTCNELNIKNVKLQLKPVKGKTLRTKHISDQKLKITDIMSEGEQKAIAMAEFSTDLQLRKNFNTVIFDDPITSLDYKRAEMFADLIYKLSSQRQVIVFTHNILFFHYLYNKSQANKDISNKFFKVDDFDSHNKGIVSETINGKLDNIKNITSKLNSCYEKIDNIKCVGEELEANLSVAYAQIRTWCELIVEEGFFKNTIRRYEPNIQFGKVSDIDGSFIQELNKVSDLFNKACRWMEGHSQPTETLNIKPTREDFRTDLEYMKNLTNKFTVIKWK